MIFQRQSLARCRSIGCERLVRLSWGWARLRRRPHEVGRGCTLIAWSAIAWSAPKLHLSRIPPGFACPSIYANIYSWHKDIVRNPYSLGQTLQSLRSERQEIRPHRSPAGASLGRESQTRRRSLPARQPDKEIVGSDGPVG